MAIYLIKKTQIKAQIGVLLFYKALTIVFVKYFNYSNIFSAKNIIKLSKYTKINIYAIKLEKCKQPSFSLIYSLEPVKLKMLKICIKTNLANSFI